jgi:hypothetical protein
MRIGSENSENLDTNTTISSITTERRYRLTEDDRMKLAKLCEYMLGLSLLIMELQEFPASKVAAACILAARKIMNIHPLWRTDLEGMTTYSYLDLVKCMNMFLDNYNEIKIGRKTFKASEILGRQPCPFELKSKFDISFDSEITNNKVKSSISPKKVRRFIQPPLLGDRTKSSTSNERAAKDRRETYYENYNKNSPPSGILKHRKNRARGKNKLAPTFQINMTLIPQDDEDEQPLDSETLKKVSFANQISVQHGSKKLIEMIDDTSEEVR